MLGRIIVELTADNPEDIQRESLGWIRGSDIHKTVVGKYVGTVTIVGDDVVGEFFRAYISKQLESMVT